jgi:hypothetical protein
MALFQREWTEAVLSGREWQSDISLFARVRVLSQSMNSGVL